MNTEIITAEKPHKINELNASRFFNTPKKQFLFALLLSIILTAIYFYDIVFTEMIFADRDTLLVYMPLFKYWAERILSGEFPDWFPYDGLGQPFAGLMLGMAFHPIKLLFLLFNVGTAIKWATLLCFPIAFNGMYLLLKQFKLQFFACLMGALLFTFNGYMVSLTNNIPYLLGMASMPWAWFLTFRVYNDDTISIGKLFLAALGYTLVLFTGEVQSFITVCIFGCILPFVHPNYENRRKQAFFYYFIIMVIAFFMTAVQWVPALHVMTQGVPGGEKGIESALRWSLHPLRVLDLLFDGANGHSYRSEYWLVNSIYHYDLNDYWARSIYFGLIGFIFCCFAYFKNKKAFFLLFGLFIITFILALGKYAGLYEAIKIIPLFRPLRYPEKMLNIIMVLLSMMAAFGVSSLVENRIPKNVLTISFEIGLLSLVIFISLEYGLNIFSKVLINTFSTKEIIPETIQAELSSLLINSFSLTALILFLIAFLVRIKKPIKYILFVGYFLLLWMSSSHVYQPAFPEFVTSPILPIQQLWKETNPNDVPRYFKASSGLVIQSLIDHDLSSEKDRAVWMFLLSPDYATLHGIETTMPYIPGVSRRFIKLNKFKYKTINDLLYVQRLYSTRHMTIWGKNYAEMNGTIDDIAYENPELGALLVRLHGFTPRAYLAKPICVDNETDALNAVIARQFNYMTHAIIECDHTNNDKLASLLKSSQNSPDNNNLGTAQIDFRKPEHVAIDVNAFVDGTVLVLTDAFYSGWTATLDGKPVDILPANLAVRGVPVPKGQHRVEFKYRTPFIIPAAISTISTMLLGIVIGIMEWVRWRKLLKNQPLPSMAKSDTVAIL